MSEESGIPYIREIVVFLLATVLVVPLFHRLKVSPILGYLAVGVLVGPFGLGVVQDVEGVRRLAELGIVFLLFTIGLELSLERLWAMRAYVFGLGGLQVLITGAVIGLVAYFWGNPPAVALILGASFALSSTAMVMQLLIERGEVATRIGRTTFSVLLFQDLAVVPLLLLVSMLGEPGDAGVTRALLLALIRAAAAVAAIMIIGRLIIRPLFRLVAGTRSPELFTALTLLGILGTAWATGATGLSMALGAFLAGLLLSETEFRPQVESDIRPIRGLLLGLFFISIGMGINVGTVSDRLFWVGASVIGLIAIKAVLATLLIRLFGLPLRDAVRSGLMLGQAGELGFIIISTAAATGLMPLEIAYFMSLVVGLSMVVTPGLPALAGWIAGLFPKPPEQGLPDLASADMEGHVIIAGFGRAGQTIAKMLAAQNVPYLALEVDSGIVRRQRENREPVFFGNASEAGVLERAGIKEARAVVISINDTRAAAAALRTIRNLRVDLPVFVRSRDLEHSHQLQNLGATAVVPEMEESSLQLAGQVLEVLDFPVETVNDCIEEARESDYHPTREAM